MKAVSSADISVGEIVLPELLQLRGKRDHK